MPELEAAAAAAVEAAHGLIDVHVIAAAGADVGDTVLPVARDGDGDFAKMYGLEGGVAVAVFLVRPDGYLGYVARDMDAEALVKHLRLTFA